jgi:hypothetical protein
MLVIVIAAMIRPLGTSVAGGQAELCGHAWRRRQRGQRWSTGEPAGRDWILRQLNVLGNKAQRLHAGKLSLVLHAAAAARGAAGCGHRVFATTAGLEAEVRG